MLLPITLCTAAAAALINLWLSGRIGKTRHAEKIIHGDGGHEGLIRRMRAHSNFTENVPLVLVLIAAIEIARAGETWLAVVAAVFILGRLAHGIGMDNPGPNPWRSGGTLTSMLVQLGLGVVAVLLALQVM